MQTYVPYTKTVRGGEFSVRGGGVRKIKGGGKKSDDSWAAGGQGPLEHRGNAGGRRRRRPLGGVDKSI